jgi:hypothetical protein
MKRLIKFSASLLDVLALLLCVSAAAANLPSGWQRTQSIEVLTAGLVKISLPIETLDAARPGLEDLRLYDEAGAEVPYLIERPAQVAKVAQAVKAFQVSLTTSTTVITLETGLAEPLDGITLETPAKDFIKAVRVESSEDGSRWQTLSQGQPIFRQPDGASHLQISLPPRSSTWLRLSVDDGRSPPVPFTGALVHPAMGEPAPGELISTSITERDENPGETRLALSLGAANVSVASVQLDTPEPLFMREVSIASPKVSEDTIREETIGQGTVYRVAVETQMPSQNLSVSLDNLVSSRELFVLIKNGNSPPLPISAVRVERRRVYLVFLARQPGAYHLLTGNAHCDAPRYDLAALGMNLKDVAVSPIKVSPPSHNPDFRAAEVLPGLEVTGAALDVSDWKFRKPVKISNGGGAQQIEPDLEVLAHARPGFEDLRVLDGSNQVPYIVQRTSISRALTPTVTATKDAKDPKLSRWIIKLPQSGLPIARLTCITRTPLFERSLSLYEELTDERGDKYRRVLGGATWTQTPERPSKEFTLALDGPVQSDTLYLETDNGDNPPIELEKFTAFYPATRILLKARQGDELFLYYGKPQVARPSYDLSLVAEQLLTAEKNSASLSAEERLKGSSWYKDQIPRQGGVFLWGILALVVVVLLFIISRLLPNSQSPAS